MIKKSNKILLAVFIVIFLSIATIGILYFTIWQKKPMTTQDWLNGFQDSLVLNTENRNQKTEKSISIKENDLEVASFYQLVEIKEQDSGTIAHIIIKETYPTLETDEFDIFDEYYFIDGIMYMFRSASGEDVVTSFSSTWDVFWEIAKENTGSSEYNFSEDFFETLDILHEEERHKMSAFILEDKKALFFGAGVNKDEIFNVALNMIIDQSLSLIDFELSYTTDEDQIVGIKIQSLQPADIVIADWLNLD